jgi:isopentenyl phosphate kinase
MCQSCIDQGFEPRWIVVLGGRTFGHDHVKDFIVKRKYVGKVIAAEELIPAQD